MADFILEQLSEAPNINMPEAIPYSNGKPMYLVEDIDNKEKFAKIINKTVERLSKQ